MNLPRYFLADLPPEANLTPRLLEEACATLKRNREQYLANRKTQGIIHLLSETADNWLQPDYPFRQVALAEGPEATGFSRATLINGLETFFRQLTADNLHALLLQDLGHSHRLEEMVTTHVEEKIPQAAMAQGPEFLVHIAAGNIPNPALMCIVLGLLLRSAQFLKCASHASFLPRLFAHSLYDADPKVASCLEIAEWRGGTMELESVLFQEADCVAAMGSDETIAKLRVQVPQKTRFVAYANRVSFAYVANDTLSGFSGKKIIAQAAQDVVAWDQLGCLSPHVIYVERGGSISPEHFARMLADELDRREQTEPRGQISLEISAGIASRRGVYDTRAAYSQETRVWWSKESTAWSVVYEDDPKFPLSCMYRFIYVKGVGGLTDVLQNAENVRGKVSTVGLAAPEGRAGELALELARWGVTRICPLGQMQNPPLTWRHDGRPALGDLVTWTNWERGA